MFLLRYLNFQMISMFTISYMYVENDPTHIIRITMTYLFSTHCRVIMAVIIIANKMA